MVAKRFKGYPLVEMAPLLPFRPWRFAEADSVAPPLVQINDPEPYLENANSVLHLAGFERKSDDRSPFVRYARGVATWQRWVQSDVVRQDEEAGTFEIDGFRYGLAPILSLRSSVSMKPAIREHYQRILEGTQVYFEPIVINENGSVIGNWELFEAAKEFSSDMHRAGKVRPSDYALVAVAPAGWESAMTRHWVEVNAKAPNLDPLSALSPRTEDPRFPTINVDGKAYQIDNIAYPDWLAIVTGSLGVATPNLNLKVQDLTEKPAPGKAWLLPPAPTLETLGQPEQFPFDSLSNSNVPKSGAILWNLRDFRSE